MRRAQSTPITNLIDFLIKDNCIDTNNGTYYFMRYMPPNTEIMTTDELLNCMLSLQRFLDTVDMDLSFFCTDKVEDLGANKEFWSSRNPKYYYLTADITKSIEGSEIDSNAVQKAFYIILQTEDQDKVNRLYVTMRGLNYDVYVTDKRENTTVLRNFLRREFISYDIQYEELEIDAAFNALSERKQKKAGGREAYFRSELSCRLTPDDFFAEETLIRQNNFFRKVIMIKNIPSTKQLGMFMELAQLQNSSFNMRLRPMEASNMKNLVNRQINAQRTRASKSKHTEKMDAASDENNIMEFYEKVSKDKCQIFYTNVYIEVYGDSKEALKSKYEELQTILKRFGISFESLNYRQKNGFMGVYPLGKDLHVNIANNIPTNTLSRLYPFSFSSLIDPHGIVLGRTVNGGLMIPDLFNWTDRMSNGNFSITGYPGQGKSYTMKKIVSQLVMSDVDIFMLDPDKNEYFDTFRELGGTCINCADGHYKINPLEVRKFRTDRDDLSEEEQQKQNIPQLSSFKKGEAMFFQHLSWLKDYSRITCPAINEKEIEALNIMMIATYQHHGLGPETDFDSVPRDQYIIYSDLYNFINELVKNRADGIRDEYSMIADDMLKSLLLIIYDCCKGSLAFLLNGHTNIPNAGLIDFGMVDLLAGDAKRAEAVTFNNLTYIWNRVSNMVNRVMLGIDEKHLIATNPVIVQYIQNFTARIRKYDGIIGTSTQQINQLYRNDIRHMIQSIYSNMAVKFVFHPGDVDFSITKELLQLTDGESSKIKVPHKRHCLVKMGADKYYMQIGSLPYEAALFGDAGGK